MLKGDPWDFLTIVSVYSCLNETEPHHSASKTVHYYNSQDVPDSLKHKNQLTKENIYVI